VLVYYSISYLSSVSHRISLTTVPSKRNDGRKESCPDSNFLGIETTGIFGAFSGPAYLRRSI
jgi:hypothetical protein